jgi:hypothetical protein
MKRRFTIIDMPVRSVIFVALRNQQFESQNTPNQNTEHEHLCKSQHSKDIQANRIGFPSASR